MIHSFKCRACGTTYSETQRSGILNPHACGPLPADKKHPERERPDKRDENTAIGADGKVQGIKSEGAGVTCLTDLKLEEPRWISALYKRIEKERGEEE